ncbi:type II toxin-antitoxin system RelE/ParE family toxin [Roseibium sp.]|uniref:type II toxin-antitoxin system RelE/ParE family toxin n=1 Tax=Roseibium sp. TaxID=1936156 RepID=UPI003B505DE3
MTDRKIKWVGDSRKVIIGFPKAIKEQIGYALFEAQSGRKAASAKPLKGIDSGIFEIVADHIGNTYRAVYAVKLGDDLYVLHAFQKKSKSGIKTPKHETDLIKDRLAKIKEKLGIRT